MNWDAVGAVAEIYAPYLHLGPEVPAMGYGGAQARDLEQALRRIPVALVLGATPVRSTRRIHLDVPIVSVDHEFAERRDVLTSILEGFQDRFHHRWRIGQEPLHANRDRARRKRPAVARRIAECRSPSRAP